MWQGSMRGTKERRRISFLLPATTLNSDACVPSARAGRSLAPLLPEGLLAALRAFECTQPERVA